MSGFLYLAYSTALVSLMTLTLICPGKSSSDSILFTTSLAVIVISASEIFSGFTIIRISRPA